VNRVWVEMNDQIINYIRGKVIEIVIVGIAYVPFALMGLRYSALLAVAVGFSVLILYRRRRGDRAGGHGGPVPVGADPRLRLADGGLFRDPGPRRQPAGPLLFSEAVNLHR
jgi:putative permease